MRTFLITETTERLVVADDADEALNKYYMTDVHSPYVVDVSVHEVETEPEDPS